MRGAAGKICAVLLATLLFGQGLAVFAVEENLIPYGGSSGNFVGADPALRICETVDELLAELKKDIGGTIGCSGEGPFVLEEGEVEENEIGWSTSGMEVTVTHPVTVYFPSNGIEVGEWASWRFNGPITFQGTQGFILWGDAGLSLSEGVAVIASDGGTAVTIHQWASFTVDSSVVLHAEGDYSTALFCVDKGYLDLGYARVIASGNHSTGIFSNGELRTHYALVEATGDNSYAIYGKDQIELGMVSVNGAVEGDPVYSVLSSFSQPPQNLIEIPVKPDMSPNESVVYENLAGKSLPVEFDEFIYYKYLYSAPFYEVGCDAPPMVPWDIEEWIGVDCAVTWDQGGLDYAVPGVYTATATLEPIVPVPLPGLSIPPLTHEITVMPQNRAALYSGGGDGYYAVVQCLAPIVDAEKILFWVYEGADGWREMTATGDAIYAAEWDPTLHFSDDILDHYPAFEISGLEEQTYYWVMAEVIGGPMEGLSNTWEVYTGSIYGGDRSGADRYGKPASFPSGPSTGTEPPEGELPVGNNGAGGSSSGGSGSADTDKPAPQVPVVKTTTVPQDSPLPPAKEDSVEAVGSAVSVESTPTRLLPEEWEDATTIAITGKRLLALLGEPVVFIKNGVRIVVDNDPLIALNIQEHQLFTVTLEGSEAGYTARFALDGEPVDLPYELILPDAPAQDRATARDVPASADIPPAVMVDVADAAGFSWTGLIVTGAVGVPSLSGGFWLLRRRLRR